MPAARIIGFVVVLATAGCACVGNAPPREPAAAGAKPAADAAAEPAPGGAAPGDSAAPPKRTAARSKPVADQPGPAAAKPAEPVTPPAPPRVAEPAAEKVASASPPAAKPPVKAAGSPAPKEPAAKKPVAAPVPGKPAAPPSLDLESLEKRLKETNAIGVLTKLTLKNQVDDLVERFKAYYAGRARTTLAELRQPYDLLILKVLSLLQDGDPSLASAIRSSREAIWGILSDPAKFSKVAG
jgi:hypothetical protein